MLGYVMANDMTPKQIGDLQKFADFGHAIGDVPEKVDVTKISADVLMVRRAVAEGTRHERAQQADGATAGAAPASAAARRQRPHVTIRGLSKRFDNDHHLRQFRSRHSARQTDLGVRAERLRQEHADQHDRRADPARCRGNPVRRQAARAEIKFGYVFQNYREALFPWLRAFDNIAYPLKLMRVPKAERRARVEKLVAHLGVKIDLKLYPYQMSGGQQQLVSIMRALVVEPEILFLDEPFSALDYEMTLFMREQLQRIFLETGTTTVLVSHDLEEAVYLADRVLLLSRHPARVADFTPVDAPRPRTDATLSEAGFRAHQGALPGSVPARGAARMKPQNVEALLAGRRRRRPARALVARCLAAMGRSGAAAVADRDIQRAVERHGRRQARLRLSSRRSSARRHRR